MEIKTNGSNDVLVTFIDYSGLIPSNIKFYKASNGKKGDIITSNKVIKVKEQLPENGTKKSKITYSISKKYLNKKTKEFFVDVIDKNNSDSILNAYFRIIYSSKSKKYIADYAPRINDWTTDNTNVSFTTTDNAGIDFVKIYDLYSPNPSKNILTGLKFPLKKGTSTIKLKVANLTPNKDGKYKLKVIVQDNNKTLKQKATRIVNFSLTKKTKPANVVDVVLFTGQSNMVGFCGNNIEEQKPDTRNLKNIIDSDILSQYKTMKYVSVQIPQGVAYEYKIGTDGKGYLSEINSGTKYFGENLTYSKGNLVNRLGPAGKYTSERSCGTNMIPQFCKTYYEKTGRKLVAVMVANGGQKISNFLPSNDSGYGDPEKKYIYEGIKTKYLSAIKYLQSNGYTIGNRFYVIYQGCADSNSNLAPKYYNTFMKFHNYLKKDLKMEFGTIVETATAINKYGERLTNVKKVHSAQESLASKNKDIIIGSKFGYNMFINKNKNAFCLEVSHHENGNIYDNSIHLTSGALSQVGKQTAKSVASYLNSK